MASLLPNLDEVLRRHNLTEQQIDVACSHGHVVEIAGKLSTWKYLAFHIGLDETDVTDIERDNSHDHRSQCLAALQKWRQKFGSNATYLSLAKGLEKVGRLDLVETVCEIFQSNRCGTTISGSTKRLGTKAEVVTLSKREKGWW